MKIIGIKYRQSTFAIISILFSFPPLFSEFPSEIFLFPENDIAEKKPEAKKAKSPITSLAEEPSLTPETFLKQFIGRWIGTVTLTTTHGDILESFEVEQQYWWNAQTNELEGLAVLDRQGALKYARSRHSVKNRVIYVSVKVEEKTSQYKGNFDHKSIIWLPLDPAKSLDYQVTETFVETEQGRILKKDGFERFTHKENKELILFSGELHFQEENSTL